MLYVINREPMIGIAVICVDDLLDANQMIEERRPMCFGENNCTANREEVLNERTE